MSAIKVIYDEDKRVLTISGRGNLSWMNTVDYRENTEKVVIEGNEIYSTNLSNLFANFKKLITIEGIIDTSNCKDMSYLYAECFNLEQPIKDLDTSNTEEFDYMHSDNRSLKAVTFNDTSKGRQFKHMFHGCDSLEHIEGLYVPDSESIEEMSDLDLVICLIIRSNEIVRG